MGQLAHAFLFSGPRGVGKTTCARILAKAINCMNPPEDGEPCNACASCTTFNEGRSLNIHELDAASNNSVDDIRNIIDQVRYVPTSGKKSVFIIDEVHMLSQAAFNAFLKTLEEPPSHAIFILATTEKHKLLPTILSRVQKFDFRRIKVDDVGGHLEKICEQENIQYEKDALQLIGLKADGALRDALSIFDQIVSFSNRHVTYKIVVENLNILDYDYYFRAVDLMQEKKYEELLLMLHEIIDLGFEARDFMVGMVEHFRNLLVSRTPKTLALLETSDNIKKRYLEQVKAIPPNLLINAFNLATESEQKLKGASNTRLQVELSLVKLAFLNDAISLAIDHEKKKLAPEAKNEKIASSPTVSKEIPQAESAEEVPHEKASDKMRRLDRKRTVIKGAFTMPKNIDDIDLNAGKKPGEEEESDEFVVYDPTVNVDKAAFTQALNELVAGLHANNNYRIASILNLEAFRLDHNKWIQTVTSEVAKRQLRDERHLVTQMRSKLKVPNLMLEIEVDEAYTNPEDAIPYTNEQKLDMMLEKNPALREFMRKFDTFMNY